MQLGFGNELVLKLDDPTPQIVPFHHPMHLAFGNIAGSRRLDHLHLEIDVMLQATLGNQDQFLKIVEMGVLSIGSQLLDQVGGNLLYDKRLLHQVQMGSLGPLPIRMRGRLCSTLEALVAACLA